VNRKLTVF